MTSQEARTLIQQAAAACDALPPDAPRAVRREARLAYERAVQDWHYYVSVERHKQQEQEHGTHRK